MSRHDEDLATAAERLLASDLSQAPKPTPDEEATLLAQLPVVDAEAPVMVVRSVRLPAELERQIKRAADADNVTTSEWVRTAIQRVLTGRDQGLISADAVIQAVQKLPHAA